MGHGKGEMRACVRAKQSSALACSACTTTCRENKHTRRFEGIVNGDYSDVALQPQHKVNGLARAQLDQTASDGAGERNRWCAIVPNRQGTSTESGPQTLWRQGRSEIDCWCSQ